MSELKKKNLAKMVYGPKLHPDAATLKPSVSPVTAGPWRLLLISGEC